MEIKFRIKRTALQAKAIPFYEILKKEFDTGKKEAAFCIIIAGNPANAYFEEMDADHSLGLVKSETSLDDILELDYECRITGMASDTELEAVIRSETTEKKTATAELKPDEKKYLEELVSEGWFSQESLDNRVAICKDHGVSFAIMKKIFDWNKERGIKGDVFPLKTAYVCPVEGKVKSKDFWNSVCNCLTRTAFILEGPKSVGKNVFAETLAFLFNMECFVIQLNENTTDGDVYGEKTTDNSAAEALTKDLVAASFRVKVALAMGEKPSDDDLQMATQYDMLKTLCSSVKIKQAIGLWVQWLQRGGIMVLNEADMADPNFYSMLVNMVLDGTGYMAVPGYGRVKINENCVLIATQNGASYAGTNTQNEASVSRFDKYILPQPKSVLPQLKSAVKGQKFEIEEKYLLSANKFYTELKKLIGDGLTGEISSAALNIRGIVRALKAVKTYDYEVTLRERLAISVVNACPEDEQGVIMEVLNASVSI